MSENTISASITGLPSSDPIFEALEKCQRAKAAYERANKASKELYDANYHLGFRVKYSDGRKRG